MSEPRDLERVLNVDVTRPDDDQDCGVCKHPLTMHEGVLIGLHGMLMCWEKDCECHCEVPPTLLLRAAGLVE